MKLVLTALLLILSFAVINVWGLETSEWTSFGGIGAPVPAKTNIVENNNSIVVEMNLDGINVEERIKEGKKFQFLSVPKTDWTSEIGKPKLPVVKTIVKIPSDGSVTIKVENEEHTILPSYNVYPVGKQIVKNGRGGTVYIDEDFTIDKGFYSTDSIYPQELANISFSGHLRDERIIQLEFHPIRYNPSSQELFCYSYLRIRLTYEGASRIMKPSGLLDDTNSFTENILMAPGSTAMGSVNYPEDLTKSRNADYIIIAPEPFYNDPRLRQFAEWRSQYSGLDVVVAHYEKLYYSFGSGKSDDEKIKAFIQYVYSYWNSPNSPDGHIKYVLLVGDAEFIPVHISEETSFGEIIATDNWYACVSGNDSMPDIMIGRFPAKTLNELKIMVDKTIQYEQNPLYGGWANNALVSVGTVESLRTDLEYARDQYLLPGGFNVKELSVLDGDSSYNMISELNKGQYILDYAGHGYVDKWEIFNSQDVQKLKNDRMLPVIFSLACSTAYFDNPNMDSLAEVFLKSKNGAIAFFGGSRLVAISSIGFGLSEAIAGSHIFNLGEITMHAKLLLLSDSTNMELYNLMGDPALDLGAPRRVPNTPDIIIAPVDVSFGPEIPKQGDIVSIKTTVNNYGSGDAQNIILEMRDGGPDGNIIETKNITNIKSGAKIGLETRWLADLGIPQHNIYLRAYLEDGPNEYYTGNNNTQKQVLISLEADGWPKTTDERSLSSPVPADINGDGNLEILFETHNYDKYNRVYILQSNGLTFAGWPKTIYRPKYDYESQYSNPSVGPVPSVGDIDGDGKSEIVVALFSKEIHAWKSDGTYVPGWPVNVDGYATTSPVLADLDSDGKQEVIFGTANGQMHVLRYDGTYFPGWPISVGQKGHLFVTVADLDGDQDNEIIACDSLLPKSYVSGKMSTIYAWHHDGTAVNGWSVKMQGAESVLPPVTGDLDGNGKTEVIVASTDEGISKVYIWNYDGSLRSICYLKPDDEIRSAIALADIDEDGDVEIIASSYDEFLYAWHHDGRAVYGFPVILKDSYLSSSPIIADVDGDDKFEIVVASHGGTIYVYKGDGTPANGWPNLLGDSTTSSTPMIIDINNDSRNELVYTSGIGSIHALSLASRYNDNNKTGWSMLLHDQRHTGSYGSNSILPHAPTDISATDSPNDKGGSMSISWKLSQDDYKAIGYIIYRSDKIDGKYSIIGKIDRGVSAYIDNTTKDGVVYWYIVRTSDESNLSASSSPVSSYSFNDFAPKIPVLMYANSTSLDGSIELNWSLGSETDLAGYKIYYGTESGVYNEIINVGLNSHFMLTGLVNDRKYYITISAYDTEGNESLISLELSALAKDEDTEKPVFSSFYPEKVTENTDFYIKCEIADSSGIYDDDTSDDGQGVYLVWDLDEISDQSHITKMSKLSSGVFITDKRIPGQSLGSQFVYNVYAYDNDFDWNRIEDRKSGISQDQKIAFVPAQMLAYNYPNPAPAGGYTDRTIFRYFVNSDSKVKINIYNISGYLVESIDSESKGTGYSETEWNISNISSGIYIYTIEIETTSGEKQIMKNKLAILK